MGAIPGWQHLAGTASASRAIPGGPHLANVAAASGDASTTLASASATAAVGTISATAGISAAVSLVGVSATGAVGTIAAEGTSTAVPGFDFDTEAGCVFGAIVGSLTSIARATSVDVVARAYDPATGALVAESGTLTTDGTTGRLARWEDAALTDATEYHLVFVRVSDGEIACKALSTT